MKNNEIKYSFGAIPSPKDSRDYQLVDLIPSAASPAALPNEYVNPLAEDIEILDQGSSSTCVACSLSYLRYLMEYGQSNNRKYFSPSYIYGNRERFGYMGEGMYPRDALSQLKKCGVCFYEDFPGFYDVGTSVVTYNQKKSELDPKAYPFRVSSYYKVNGVTEIKNAIYKLGGVTGNFPVYECLYYPEDGGIVNYNEDKPGQIMGYHEMTIVGWKEDCWVVLNSWGKQYGDNGFCYVPFNYPMVETWATVDEVMEVIYKMAKFRDTEGHWAEESIDKAADKGVVNGVGDDMFKPDEFVTRAQLCAILDRLNLLN